MKVRALVEEESKNNRERIGIYYKVLPCCCQLDSDFDLEAEIREKVDKSILLKTERRVC